MAPCYPSPARGVNWMPHPCQASSSSRAGQLNHEMGWFNVSQRRDELSRDKHWDHFSLNSEVAGAPVYQYSWLAGRRCFTPSRQEDYSKSLNKENSAREH